ncbi:MAG: type 4a pilus biogenesis protein PilO [bacterium]
MNKIIIILISVGISATLIFVVVKPLSLSVIDLRDELVQKKQQISDTQELLNKTEQLKFEYEEVEQDAQKIFLALPEESDIPYLLVQFEDIALSNGLLMDSISFGDIVRSQSEDNSRQGTDMSEGEEFYEGSVSTESPVLSVSLSLSGSYDALKGFLSDLENNARPMNVSSLKFGSSQGSGSVGENAFVSLGIFNFDLGIDVYYLK